MMEVVPSTEVIRRGTLRSALWQRLGSVSERTVRVRSTKTSTRPAVPVLVLVSEPAATPNDDSEECGCGGPELDPAPTHGDGQLRSPDPTAVRPREAGSSGGGPERATAAADTAGSGQAAGSLLPGSGGGGRQRRRDAVVVEDGPVMGSAGLMDFFLFFILLTEAGIWSASINH